MTQAPPRSPTFRIQLAAASSIVLVLIAAGCSGPSLEREEWEAGSAVWLEADSAGVTPEALRRLSGSGASEAFVRAARVDWQGDDLDFTRVAELDPPRRTTLTLAISGTGPTGGDAVAKANQLADQLLQLKLDAETRGWTLRGFHLDLSLSDTEGLSEFLERLRRRTDERLALSIRLPESWLRLEPKQLLPILEPIDFYTLRIYGQTIGQQKDRAERWEIDKSIARVQKATEVGKPFLAEILTVGWVVRLSSDGEERDRAYGIPLRALLTNRNFEVEPIFAFSGFDRQVFELEAKRTGRLGGLRVREGERLRVVRPTAAHLARLHRGLVALESEVLIGELYRSWPSELQTLSVGAEALARALDDTAIPGLRVTAERLSEGGTFEMKFELHNPDVVTTSMAVVETNYLEVEVENAGFGTIRTGDFRRYTLGRRGEEEDSIQAVRNANRLRLYFPIMEPGWTITTGPIRFYARKNAAVRVGAHYVLPDGEAVVLTPVDWQTLAAREADLDEDELAAESSP